MVCVVSGCGRGTWWYVWYLAVVVVPVLCVVPGGRGTWWYVWYLVGVVPGRICGTWWAWYLVVCVVPGGCGRGTWWYVWYLVGDGTWWYVWLVWTSSLHLASYPFLQVALL